MKIVFEVSIEILGRGDSYYKGYEGDCTQLAVAPDFESAVQHMKKRIQKISDTFTGEEEVVSEVKEKLSEILEDFDQKVNYKEEKYYDSFYLWVETGFFTIRKLEETTVDGIRTYTRV